jgi:hypothetical protein
MWLRLASFMHKGQWIQLYFRCRLINNIFSNSLAICRTIFSIKNGKVIGKGRLHIEGDKISFACNPNYLLDGEEVIRCTSTGQWNASQPVCKLQGNQLSVSV